MMARVWCAIHVLIVAFLIAAMSMQTQRLGYNQMRSNRCHQYSCYDAKITLSTLGIGT